MIFFTDITTNSSSYCLLNVNKLNDPKRKDKKVIFIDPGVYELAKGLEYSKRDLCHQLTRNGLPKNEFISIDYPCDMIQRFDWNKYWKEHCKKYKLNPEKDILKVTQPDIEIDYYLCNMLIQKSYFNNLIHKDNPNYICTIQSEFLSYDSFVQEAEKLKPIWSNNKKIIGIGNLCRIMKPNRFTDMVYSYIKDEMKGHQVHIYGMPISQIKKYAKLLESNGIILSCDSTKWTRRIHIHPPLDKSTFCRRETRDIYFLEYMKEIKKFVNEILF